MEGILKRANLRIAYYDAMGLRCGIETVPNRHFFSANTRVGLHAHDVLFNTQTERFNIHRLLKYHQQIILI